MAKKALVISGGGALGAWGAGVAKGLYDFHDKDYELYVGTSTGSLMAPLIASKEFDALEAAYTSVNSDSIYSVKPFKKNGKLRMLNLIWRLITGKTSIGDSSRLKCLIDKFVTENTYNIIKKEGKIVASCVVNLTLDEVEYYSSDQETLKDYKDWMEASASAPVIMNLISKNGNQYTDGGIIDSVPIEYAIQKGCTEIDVIIHKQQPSDVKKTNSKIKNLFNMAEKLFVVLLNNVWKDDVKFSAVVDELSEDVKINYYYMPYRLTNNSLNFNKKEMKRWFKLGYLGMNRKDRVVAMKRTVVLSGRKGRSIKNKSYYK